MAARLHLIVAVLLPLMLCVPFVQAFAVQENPSGTVGMQMDQKELSPDEAYRQGLRYEDGETASKDLGKAEKHYLIAADYGHVEASLRLMRLYSEDALGTPDWRKAYYWGLRAQQHMFRADDAFWTEMTAIAKHLTSDEAAAERAAAKADKLTRLDIVWKQMNPDKIARLALVCTSGYLMLGLLWLLLREQGVPLLRRHRNKTVLIFAFFIPLISIVAKVSQWPIMDPISLAVLQDHGNDKHILFYLSFLFFPGLLCLSFLNWWPHVWRPFMPLLLFLPYAAAMIPAGMFFHFVIYCSLNSPCVLP